MNLHDDASEPRLFADLCRRSPPVVVNYAVERGIELPFSDYASLKAAALNAAKGKVVNAGIYVTSAAFHLALSPSAEPENFLLRRPQPNQQRASSSE